MSYLIPQDWDPDEVKELLHEEQTGGGTGTLPTTGSAMALFDKWQYDSEEKIAEHPQWIAAGLVILVLAILLGLYKLTHTNVYRNKRHMLYSFRRMVTHAYTPHRDRRDSVARRARPRWLVGRHHPSPRGRDCSAPRILRAVGVGRSCRRRCP